jgi:hypothetical protein
MGRIRLHGETSHHSALNSGESIAVHLRLSFIVKWQISSDMLRVKFVEIA